MLRPIPGFSHLKLLDPTPPSRTITELKIIPDNGVRALVQVALEVAYGIRPDSTLHHSRFDPRIKIHLSALRKRSSIRGPVRVRNLEAHPALPPANEDPLAIKWVEALEITGTYQVAGTHKAFASRLERAEGKRHWVMRSLRMY